MEKNLFIDISKIVIIAILCLVGLEHFDIVLQGAKFIFSLFLPFLLGLCIAFVFNVILKPIEKQFHFKNKKINRVCSLVLTLFLVFGLVLFVMMLIIPELQNTIQLLIANIPAYQEQIVQWMNDFEFSKDIVNQVQEHQEQMNQSISNFIKGNSSNFLNLTLGFTTSLVSGIFNFILGIVFAIYILLEKEKYGKQTKKLLYACFPKKKAENIIDLGLHSHKVFSNFVSGQLMEAIIIGILCFLGMVILGLPYAPTISVLVGFTALIPVFGAFFGTAIGAILIFVIEPMQAILFIIFILVLQQIEGNLIYPKVVGGSVGLPSIWVMLAVTIGGSTLGIVGMLISVPLCSILYTMTKSIVNKRLKQKKVEV